MLKCKCSSLSCAWLFATLWTVAHQAPLSMKFSSQEYWSGLPFPLPGDLPNPGIKPRSPALEANSLLSEPPGLCQLMWSGFHSGSNGKKPACNEGDLGSIPGLGRSPGRGNGYLLQYYCLKNSMNRGAWYATVHGVTKSWTWLSDFYFFRNITMWEWILPTTWMNLQEEPFPV